MRNFFFLTFLICSALLFAEGPFFQQKDPMIKQEFENVYKDLRRNNGDKFILNQNTLQQGSTFYVSSGTVQGQFRVIGSGGYPALTVASSVDTSIPSDLNEIPGVYIGTTSDCGFDAGSYFQVFLGTHAGTMGVYSKNNGARVSSGVFWPLNGGGEAILGQLGSNPTKNLAFWSGGATSNAASYVQLFTSDTSLSTVAVIMANQQNMFLWNTNTSGNMQLGVSVNTYPVLIMDNASILGYRQAFLKGSGTNDLARAGDYGEKVEASSGSVLNAAGSGAFLSYTQIVLSSGNWRCTGTIGMQSNGATITVEEVAISTSPNSTTDHTFSKNMIDATRAFGTGDFNEITVPRVPYELANQQTLYLKGMFTYSAGTPRMNSSYIICERPR